jgi:hypothetical protein
MVHWLEEAEKKQQEKDYVSSSGHKEENIIISENHQKIAPFITQLNELTNRVAKISQEDRKPSIEIGNTHLEGDLRYEYYGSAFRIINGKHLLIFPKKKNYLFWRRIYLTVTDSSDLIKITLYEKGTFCSNHDDIIKKKFKYLTKINKLQDSLCLLIIDWLVFKISTSDLKHNIPSVK